MEKLGSLLQFNYQFRYVVPSSPKWDVLTTYVQHIVLYIGCTNPNLKIDEANSPLPILSSVLVLAANIGATKTS